MKAFVLHGAGDIRLENVPVPVPKKDEVLIKVQAAGICGSDIPRIYETGAHVHPLIPGHEFSGVVVQAGRDTAWQAGQRAGVYPLIPCGRCLPCKRRQFEMCRNYSYLGSRRDGGFAEYAAVPADCLIRLPDSVPFEEAAMLEPMAVAVHAMRRAAPGRADTAVVCGMGTIGLLLLMFLLEAVEDGGQGARILAVGNKEPQRQAALRLGLPQECFCNAKEQDAVRWVMEQTDGSGADVFFECVGRNETVMQAVECAAAGGRIVLTGNPHSDMGLEKNTYWKLLRNQLTVMGTWNSDKAADWHDVLEYLSQKRVSPAALITHRFPLEELEQGFHIMRDKTADHIKIMAVMEGT